MRSRVTEAVKTVAIDVDSVLADVMLVWTDEYNKRNKAQITKKEIANWDIPTVLPITPPQIYRYFTYVWKYRWLEIPPTEPKIGEVTKRIHRKGYRISIIQSERGPQRPTCPSGLISITSTLTNCCSSMMQCQKPTTLLIY